MNDRQENKLSMAKAVQQLLSQNLETIGTPPAFLVAKSDLDNVIASIDGLQQTQAKQITGIATEKNAVKAAAINAATEIIGPVISYATNANDNTLKESVSYTANELNKMRDTVLSNTLFLIRDTVQARLTDLADFGIDAGAIDNFTTMIAAFTPWIGAPRSAASVKSAATKAIVVELKNQDVVLERLDGLAETKKNTNSTFYTAYQAARQIVDNTAKGNKKDNPPPSQPQE